MQLKPPLPTREKKLEQKPSVLHLQFAVYLVTLERLKSASKTFKELRQNMSSDASSHAPPAQYVAHTSYLMNLVPSLLDVFDDRITLSGRRMFQGATSCFSPNRQRARKWMHSCNCFSLGQPQTNQPQTASTPLALHRAQFWHLRSRGKHPTVERNFGQMVNLTQTRWSMTRVPFHFPSIWNDAARNPSHLSGGLRTIGPITLAMVRDRAPKISIAPVQSLQSPTTHKLEYFLSLLNIPTGSIWFQMHGTTRLPPVIFENQATLAQGRFVFRWQP